MTRREQAPSGGAGQRREGSVLGGALPAARHLNKQAVIDYLSGSREFGRAFDYNPVVGTVEVVADPQVDGTYAAQFQDVSDSRTVRTVQLLFVTGHEEGTVLEALEATLEEVEFTSWPPTSGSLRFL